MKSLASTIFPSAKAEARKRLVVAHLALRQRDDRLQIEVDAVLRDRLADDGGNLLLALALEGTGRRGRGRRGFRGSGGLRCRRFGLRLQSRRRRRNDRVMDRHQLGEILDEIGQFPDLAGEGRGDRFQIGARRSFQRRHAAAQRADLAGDVGGGARQFLEALGNLGAVAVPRGHHLASHQREQDRERNIGCFRGLNAGDEMQRGPDRGRDQRHADDDENGADTHLTPQARGSCRTENVAANRPLSP